VITEDSVDSRYGDPSIEVNEERQEPAPHRYVHGSFKGTPGKFSFYFPPKARYQGRFFHNTYPLIANADAGPSPIDFKINEGNLGFTFASGAYFVQTNQGAGADRQINDPSISSGYRLNAAAAKFSRMVAKEIYGSGDRPYGYIHGGSGGSYQVMGCAENTSGVWDGFLPYVMGTPYSLPSMTAAAWHAHRVLGLRNKFPGILDAIDPGGSGDPYADLNEEERGALREATLMGFPLRAWWQHQSIALGGGIADLTRIDSTYADDFWSKPGYLGTDLKSSVREDRVQFETTVEFVTPGTPATVGLAQVPDRSLSGAQFTVISGAAAGQSLPVARIDGKTLTLGMIIGLIGLPGALWPASAPDMRPGDKVRIDNSMSLAFQTSYRHSLPPSPDYYAWNQFRDSNGAPRYPQRAVQSPVGAINTIGSMPTGRITGKVLVMECLMDMHAWPWQADWYRSKVKEALGSQAEDNFALWYVDHAQHDVPGHFGTQGMEKAARARTIDPIGVLQQGLRDLSAWVERGEHPTDTHYRIVDTQVQLPPTARERGGIQAVVTLQVNGSVRAETVVGTTVKFEGAIEVPPGAGKVVAVEWDFEGDGAPHPKEALGTPDTIVRVSGQYAYSKPGTYFALLRGFSHREGNVQTPYAQVENIARVRVVVS
jgi:hypothetical protein